jgi:hypothetical protein
MTTESSKRRNGVRSSTFSRIYLSESRQKLRLPRLTSAIRLKRNDCRCTALLMIPKDLVEVAFDGLDHMIPKTT